MSDAPVSAEAASAPPAPAPVYVPDRRYLVCNLVAIAVAGVVAVPAFFLPQPPRSRVFREPPWNDGRHERARYDVKWSVASQLVDGELVQSVDIPPGSESSFMMRLELAETEPQGGGGVKVIVMRDDPWRFVDAQWDARMRFPPCIPDAVLCVTLRGISLGAAGSTLAPTCGGWPSDLRIRVVDDETVRTGVGDMLCAHVVIDMHDAPTLELWISREPPRAIARWRTGDGSSGLLRSLERLTLW